MELKNVRPVGNVILLKPTKTASETASGIKLPDSMIKNEPFGEVIAIGSEVSQVEIGQKAAYTKHAGTHVEIEGVDYLFLREYDLISVI